LFTAIAHHVFREGLDVLVAGFTQRLLRRGDIDDAGGVGGADIAEPDVWSGSFVSLSACPRHVRLGSMLSKKSFGGNKRNF